MRPLIVGAVIVAVVFGGFLVISSQRPQTDEQVPKEQTQKVPLLTPTPQEQNVAIEASFAIVTNGLVRRFAFPMYHNLSSDVYIDASDPTVVYVKKRGVTWNNFFETLPMKLTKECLTTGTKETFCTGATGALRFYLNGIEDRDLLDREIKNGDKARIEFRRG